MGTEIRTFASLKELNEYLLDQSGQYRALFEDYSQWLGSLLRNCEADHKNEDWYQKSAAQQKNMRVPTNKASPVKDAGKKGNGKGKPQSSAWIQTGNVSLSSTEQGQAEILFEAIEKINSKIQDMEKFKASVQQLERMGLGKNVTYIVYVEDDLPKKIVLRTKDTSTDDVFKFATELSIPATYNDFSNK